MRCYDCGHQVHGSEDCIECPCTTWRDPADERLRERPTIRYMRSPLPEDGDADENPRELMDLDEQEIDEPSGYEPALLEDGDGR